MKGEKFRNIVPLKEPCVCVHEELFIEIRKRFAWQFPLYFVTVCSHCRFFNVNYSRCSMLQELTEGETRGRKTRAHSRRKTIRSVSIGNNWKEILPKSMNLLKLRIKNSSHHLGCNACQFLLTFAVQKPKSKSRLFANIGSAKVTRYIFLLIFFFYSNLSFCLNLDLISN